MGDPEIVSYPPAVSYYWGLMRWCLACITVIVPFLRDNVPSMHPASWYLSVPLIPVRL